MLTVSQTNPLGKLEIVEVYEYYDRPVLFACRNISGQIYLAVWSDELEDRETWLYVPMSNTRFSHVRSGFIDLHDAFANPEDGFVYEVIMQNGEDTPLDVNLIPTNMLSSLTLPTSGEKLSLQTQTIPTFSETLFQRATQTRREVVDLALNFIDDSRTEAPAGKLGSILLSFQNVINTIGNKIFGSGGLVGRLPQRTVVDMQFNITSVGAGSFKVSLASSSNANLFDDTTVGDAVQELVSIMDLSENEIALKEKLMNLGPRVASAYVGLLENVNIDVTRLKIDWASPNNHRSGSASISSEAAQRTAAIIKQFEEQAVREYEIVSTLIGANIRTMKFELEVGDTRILGDVEDEAKEAVDGATIGRQYIAHIREVTIYKSMVEEATIKSYLLGLRPPLPE